MSIHKRRWVWVAAVAGALALSPAFAQHGGGGGGHAGGGGGGGHAGGGGHMGGGHVGGGFHSMGHFGGGAPHFAAAGHYGGGVAASGHGYGAGLHGSAYGGHAAYGYPGGGYTHHGYSTGAYWRGGYWRGAYWPRAYYGYGFSWFLPILPLAYATYWYGGVPYYYANDVYYTWNPDYDGYTATDPPPVNDSGAAGVEGSALPPTDLGAQGGAPQSGSPQAQGFSAAPPAGAGAQIFMYPKNGQSDQQQSTDRRECQQWAASQAGAGDSADYRRAMMACVEGRGYSAN